MSNLASEVSIQEETTAVRRIDASAELSLGMLGISERGPIGECTTSSSFAEWQKQHGDHTLNNLDVVEAVRGFFDNGGTVLKFGRVVHSTVVGDPTTKTSAAATCTLATAATSPSAGTVTSAVQPYNMEPGQTLVVAFEAGGDQTFTFAAVASSLVSGAEPFALVDAQTLTFVVNGGAMLTKVFGTAEFAAIGAATAEEVVASLNAFFAANDAGVVATLTGGGTTVTVTTTRRGTGASLVIGGTAAALGALIGTAAAGTGDAANIDSVTAAEVVTKLSTLTNGTVAAVGGAVKLTSATTGGSSTAQVKSSSTADTPLGFDNAVHTGSAGAAVNTLTVNAKTDGEYGNELSIQIAAATSGDADRFNLYVVRNGVVRERYFNLTMDPLDSAYVETAINDSLKGSDLISVVDLEAATSAPEPAVGTTGPMTGGSDGLTSLADTDYSGGETANGSLGFRLFDEHDVDVVITPGRATSAVHNAAVTYCEVTRAGLAFAIFDPPANMTASQIVQYVESTASLLNLSDKAAIYWPRVKVANPSSTLFGNEPTVTVAPSGHIAGIYARNDARKVGGAFEQPAGTEVGIPRGVLGLETDEVKKKHKRDLVFPKLINPISQEKGTPIFVDGARTLKSTGAWPSVGQRRGVIFVEKKLIPGLAFMRHRNINTKLYKEGKRAVDLFLLELTRAGCFKSTDPRKAFFTDFSESLNPASVQQQKQVRARIGLATSEPAEYVILYVSPDTRALDEELAALAA
jgi:uncharacterized protein